MALLISGAVCASTSEAPEDVWSECSSSLSAIPLPKKGQAYFEQRSSLNVWDNPEIVVFSDGAEIVGNALHIPAHDVPLALAGLPKEAWPEGRIVEILEPSDPGADQDLAESNAFYLISLLTHFNVRVVPRFDLHRHYLTASVARCEGRPA